jgi:hypothetical protein
MRKVLVVVALLALAVPVSAPAKGADGARKAPAKECKDLRARMGGDAFKAAFGSKRRCVARKKKAHKAALKRARRACRAKGYRGKALKRCLRGKLAADPAPKPADYEDAVDECKTELADDPEGFAAEHGDGSAAFNDCVAEEVGDEEPADEPADDELEPEDGEDGEGDLVPDDELAPDEL